MKTRRLHTAIIVTIPFILACGLLQPKATPISKAPPTRTPRPTFTAVPPTQPPVIETAPAEEVAEADVVAQAQEEPTATPEPVEQPTETPTPEPVPTDTPEPQATDTPVPPPTNTPAPPPPPTDTPVPEPAGPQVGAHGISGKVIPRDKTTFAKGEKAFFTYEANNHSDQPVNFTLLGIKASNGQFNTSWINPDTIYPGVPFRHDDGLAFDVPGTYQVFLAICYAFCGESNAVWEEFPSGAATITVQ